MYTTCKNIPLSSPCWSYVHHHSHIPLLSAIVNPKIRKDLYISNENKSPLNTKTTGIRWLSSLIRQWMPVIFKGSVMNNVSLSASNLILNHKNNESYYYHTTLIRLLRFQVNIYPANYYYHDSIGNFIIRTGCLFELLGIIPENSDYST